MAESPKLRRISKQLSKKLLVLKPVSPLTSSVCLQDADPEFRAQQSHFFMDFTVHLRALSPRVPAAGIGFVKQGAWRMQEGCRAPRRPFQQPCSWTQNPTAKATTSQKR